MAKKLFVGSLPFRMSDEELAELFAPHGTVESAIIIMDRDSGRSKGFGFVEFSTDEEAAAAIKALHDTDLDGRKITVSEAKPRPERTDRPSYDRR